MLTDIYIIINIMVTYMHTSNPIVHLIHINTQNLYPTTTYIQDCHIYIYMFNLLQRTLPHGKQTTHTDIEKCKTTIVDMLLTLLGYHMHIYRKKFHIPVTQTHE